MYIRMRSTKVSQAQGTIKLSSHPITTGLISLMWATKAGGIDLVDKNRIIFSEATGSIKTVRSGIAHIGTTVGDGMYSNPYFSTLAGSPDDYYVRPSTSPISLFCNYTTLSAGGSRSFFAGAGSANLGIRWGYSLNATANIRQVDCRLSGVTYSASSGTWSTSGIKGLTLSESTLKGYDNGFMFASTSVASKVFTYRNVDPLILGGGGFYSEATGYGEGQWVGLWSRVLSDNEIALLTSSKGWILVDSVEHNILFKVSSIAITYPSSDILATGWTSTAGSLTAAINEIPASDAEYITSPDSAGTVARITLAPSLPPGSYVLNIRVKDNYSGGNVVVTFTDSTGTPNYGSTTISLTGSYLTYSVPITISGGTATSCNIYQTGY